MTSFLHRIWPVSWRVLWRGPALEWFALALVWMLFIAQFETPFSQPTSGGLNLPGILQAWLDPAVRPASLEFERLAGTLLPAHLSLSQDGRLPAWNPFIGAGQPVFNNPFSYLFNPFYSLPVLLLGGPQGSKLAVLLALLIAGLSMWALARAVGLGAAARVLCGGLYLMSGGLVAKFAVQFYSGHFQLGLSLAWPPLVLAGLWWTLRSRDRRAPILLALAFALLFCSGNIYYTLHTLVCCAVVTAVHLAERTAAGWRWRGDRLRRVVVGGAFAFGLAAVQFLPVWAVRDSILHSGDPLLQTRYSLAQAAANLVLPYSAWKALETPQLGLLAVVDYAYIGPAVLLLVALALAIGLWRGLGPSHHRMAAGLALLLGLAMMAWGAGQTPIVQELYARIPLLAQFRFVGRAHSIAALWWILLAGIALDTLWKRAGGPPGERTRLARALLAGAAVWGVWLVYSAADRPTRLGLALGSYATLNALDGARFANLAEAASLLPALGLAAAGLDSLWLAARRPGWAALRGRLARLGLLAIAGAALLDVMLVNGPVFMLERALPDFRPVYAAARQQEPDAPFPIVNEPMTPLAFAGYEAHIRSWGLSEGWRPGAPPGIIPAEAGALRPLPRWAIVSNIFGGAARTLAQDFVRLNAYQQRGCFILGEMLALVDPCDLEQEVQPAAVLYELPQALPYAFLVSQRALAGDPGALRRDDTLPVQAVRHQQDVITIRAELPPVDEPYYLVVQEANFPGWRAAINVTPVEIFTAETDQMPNERQGLIAIPARTGLHTYTLTYEPPGLAAGALLSLAALVAMGVYGFRRQKSEDAAARVP